jgi:hypothetical protein
MEQLLASAAVPSGVGCDTVLLVGGRGIVTLVLHPLLFELHDRGPLAGPYGPHTAWLLTVTVEVGVNVVAVLDLVVAVHVAFAPVLDERAVAVRVEAHLGNRRSYVPCRASRSCRYYRSRTPSLRLL